MNSSETKTKILESTQETSKEEVLVHQDQDLNLMKEILSRGREELFLIEIVEEIP